jgi:succinoglycan biosynthesis transport protein ExoP
VEQETDNSGSLKASPETALGPDTKGLLRLSFLVVREGAWILAVSLSLGLLAAGVHLATARRVYSARALLLVEASPRRVANVEDVVQEDLRAAEAVKTVQQTVASLTVLKRVVVRPDVRSDPVLSRELGVGKKGDSLEVVAEKLASKVRTILRPGTRLIEVFADAGNPGSASLLANAVAEEAVKSRIESRVKAAAMAQELLLKEAARLRGELEEAEKALQAYKEKERTVSLGEEENIILEKLKSLNKEAAGVRAERAKIEAQREQIQAIGKKVEALLGLEGVAKDPQVSALRAKIDEKKADIALLSQRYKEKHPKMIQAKSELGELEQALKEAALDAPQRVEQAYQGALARERQIEAALKAQEALALSLSRKRIAYNVLEREVETRRTAYQGLLKRLQEASIAQSAQGSDLSIVDPANPPDRPSRPRTGLSLALALFGGGGLGLLLSYLCYGLKGAFQSVEEVEGVLGKPVVGVVPWVKREGQARDNGEAAIWMLEEAFRTAVHAIRTWYRGQEIRAILVTSSVSGEGKTFCSLGLGKALAELGLRTVLVDADLYKASLSCGVLGSSSPASPTVVDLLTSPGKAREGALRPLGESLFLLPAERLEEKAIHQLLGSPRLSSLLSLLRREFDCVIVDGPPLLEVGHTIAMASYFDLVCFVVRMHQTPRSLSLRGLQHLFRSNPGEITLLANGFEPVTLDRYYGYGSYGYGYGGYQKDGALGRVQKEGSAKKDGAVMLDGKKGSWLGFATKSLQDRFQSFLGRRG